MKCERCGRDSRLKKTKDAYICKSCIKKMQIPACIKENISQFRTSDLIKLDDYRQHYGGDAVFKINENICFKNSGITITPYTIPYKNIKSISFGKHPFKDMGNGSAKCIVTLVVELKAPAVVIEYEIDYHSLQYNIYKDSIYFSETIYEERMNQLSIHEFLISGFNSYGDYAADKAKRKKSYKRQSNNNRKNDNEALRDARLIFRLGEKYTKEDVKKARNELIKKYHPDMGGSEEFAQKINDAYDLLIKEVG